MKDKKELAPLYRANVSFSRKLGIYRVSLILGREIADPTKLTLGEQCAFRPYQERDGRFYIGSMKIATNLVAMWVSKNKENK